MKKLKRDLLYALMLISIVVAPFAWVCAASEPTPEVVQKESEAIIQWKEETELEDITIEPVQPEGSETTTPHITESDSTMFRYQKICRCTYSWNAMVMILLHLSY